MWLASHACSRASSCSADEGPDLDGAAHRALPLGRDEESPGEGGERIILAVDPEQDPQHRVRVMETLEMGDHS